MGRNGEIFFQVPENGDNIEILDSPNMQVRIEAKEDLYIEDDDNFGEYHEKFEYETVDRSRGEEENLNSLFEEEDNCNYCDDYYDGRNDNSNYCNDESDDCGETNYCNDESDDCGETNYCNDESNDNCENDCYDCYDDECRADQRNCSREEHVSCEERIKAAYKKGFEEGKEIGIENGFKAAVKYFMCKCRRGY